MTHNGFGGGGTTALRNASKRSGEFNFGPSTPLEFGPSNIGALIIRIGFWGHYITITVRNPQHSMYRQFFRPLYYTTGVRV